MQARPQSPCRYCSDRVLGCHGTCVEYNKYTIENKERNEAIRKSLMEQNLIRESDFTGTSPRPGVHRKTRGSKR